MPSTYSSNLKIELMSTGENSGTWGNITNTNLGTALEQAIVGYGTVDYLSDANLTISITNSNSAQAARALVLNVTSSFGSLTQTRELVVPTSEKQYIVQNNTTGGQSITVKTSAGTGITVPNGRKAHLYVDGTNVVQMFDFVDINGGAIDGTPIGGSSAAAGSFTTLGASGAATFNGAVTLGDAAADLLTFNGTINSHLLFTDNTYDIGASGATRPRNLFLAGNATVGGDLAVGGTLTLTGGLTLNGNVTVGDNASDTLTINSTITSNLIFTDNTYDIGASGATRPRNLYLSNNLVVGGAQTLTGALTVDSTTDSSSTTTGSIQTDGGMGVAKALYVGTTLSVAGNTTLGDASTDTVQVNGYMGVGGTADSDYGLYIKSSALTGVAQVGFRSSPVGTSGATTSVRAVLAKADTAAAAFTVADVAQFWASNSSKGAGSTITNQHGVYIADQTQGTNNYGITSVVSSGTDKWNIYASGTAANYFAGNIYSGDNSTATAPFAATYATLSSSSGSELVLRNSSGIVSGELIGGVAFGHDDPTTGGTPHYAGIQARSIDTSGTMTLGFYTGLANYEANTPQVLIDSSGNVGIGTTSPQRLLHLANDGSTDQLIIQDTDHNNTGEYWLLGSKSGVLDLSFTNNASGSLTSITKSLSLTPTEAVFNDPGNDYDFRVESDTNTHALFVQGSDGFVGIGTSSPGTLLELYGASTAVIRLTDNDGSVEAGSVAGKIEFNNLDTTSGGVNAYIAGINESNIEGSIALTFATGTANTATERLRIDSAGNVGIGTSSPSAVGSRTTVHVNGTAGAAVRLSDDVANAYLDYTDTSGARLFVNAAEPLLFGTNSTERLRIDSSGYLRMASGTGGIQFNGDTAAANALDDYEEGTWTPVFSDASSGGNTATYSSAGGTYTKIGRVVHFTWFVSNINTSGMTGANSLFIQGLPFTSTSSGFTTSSVYANLVTQTANYTTFIHYISTGVAYSELLEVGTNNLTRNVTIGQLASGTADIRVSGTYHV